MKQILLTAFEPFGGETLNPSLEVALALEQVIFDRVELSVEVLPVDRFQALDKMRARLRTMEPDLILMLGEAGSRFKVTPERVAINVDDYSIPDNGGNQPQGEVIVTDGPVGYFSTLPIGAIVDALKQAEIPAAISNSAGTYLCNRLFYCVMHDLAVSRQAIPAGFMHLPYLHEQTVHQRIALPSLSRQTLVEAVHLAIEVCAHHA